MRHGFEEAHLTKVSLVDEPAFELARVLAVRKGRRTEYEWHPDPESPRELYRAELERLDAELAALARVYIGRWDDQRDELVREGMSLKLRVSYTRDPRYRRILELRREIAAERQSFEPRRAERDHQPRPQTTIRRFFETPIRVR